MNNKDTGIPTIDSLHKEKSSKEKSKYDILNIVLNKCIEKIIYTNRHTNKTYVIFEVPQILIGHPMYEMNSCIIFLMQQFIKKGYIVEFIEPFYLYIDLGNRTDNRGSSTSNHITHQNTLRHQTQQLLKQFPNRQIEIIFEDQLKDQKKGKKKR